MPLGVVAVVYEARPNVTIDAAALCLKSGNAIVLRGSSSAARSNAVLAAIAARAAEAAGVPEGAISILAGGEREELVELATQTRYVDLIIPRGGEGLKAALLEHATVPVIYAASGNCHVYVDAAADLEQARAIALNAKVQRPGVCNAAETLLVHRDVAAAFLPARARGAARRRRRAARRSSATRELAPAASRSRRRARTTGTREYLALTLAVGVVDSLEDAIEHIAAHGTGHSEAIVTRDAGGRAALPARGRRRLRLRQRLDALHRRRRVRDGRGDRQLDAEAPRPRADRAARAVRVQVPGRGRRARS